MSIDLSTLMPLFEPNFAPTPQTLFHDVVIQLAYRHGQEPSPAQTQQVAVLVKRVEQVLQSVGGEKDALNATVPLNSYGVTLEEVAQQVSAKEAASVAATIDQHAQQFAEYVTMDLEPFVEREAGEEDLTSAQITGKVLLAMAVGSEYPLGRLSRAKASPK